MSSSALPSTEDLRRPQRECLDVLYETWGDDEVGDEVYCQLWCGVGKTLVYFVAMSQLEIERVMLVVPSLELVRQVRRDYLETFGLLDEWDIVCSEPGSEFVSAVDFDGNENRHVLTTYASLPKLAEQAFDLVIYDEAHHLKDEGRHANTMVSWYFSATLPVEYQEILHYRYDFCDAIRDGFAQDFCIEVFVRPKSEEVDLPTLLHGLAEETGNQKLLVFTRFAQTDDRSVVAWVDENAGKIKDLGGWCKSLVGTTPTAQRAMILGEFESREGWSVVASCKVLAEGVDTKGADSLLFADPKSSYVDILQNVGRVTRRKKHDRPASIIVPIFVDPDKYRGLYAMCSGTRDAVSATLEEEMKDHGDFRGLCNVLAVMRDQFPEFEGLCGGREVNGRESGHSDKDLDCQEKAARAMVNRLRVNVTSSLDILWSLEGEGALRRQLVSLLVDNTAVFEHRALAMAQELRAFLDGHGRPPSGNPQKGAVERRLGIWLSNQRRVKRKALGLGTSNFAYYASVDGLLSDWLGQGWWEDRPSKALRRAREFEVFMGQNEGRIPRSCGDKEERRLAIWFNNQRKAKRKLSSTFNDAVDDILKRLLGDGWCSKWDSEANARKRVHELKVFMEKHEDRLPSSYARAVDEQRLGRWLFQQKLVKRKALGIKVITAHSYYESVDKSLTALLGEGWWKEQDAETTAREKALDFKAYLDEHKGQRPSSNTAAKGSREKKLGAWFDGVRTTKRNALRSPGHKPFYKSVDAILTGCLGDKWWGDREDNALDQVLNLKIFQEKNQRLPSIAKSSVGSEEYRLGCWLRNQWTKKRKAIEENKIYPYRRVDEALTKFLGKEWWFPRRSCNRSASSPPTKKARRSPSTKTDPREALNKLSREELIERLAKHQAQQQQRGKFPADVREHDEDKQWCNARFVEAAAAAAQKGYVVFLDSPALTTTLKLLEAGVPLDRMLVPQFDAEEYVQMKDWPHVRHQSLHDLLASLPPESVGALWADYCCTWGGNESVRPREDMELAKTRVSPTGGGSLFVTVSLRGLNMDAYSQCVHDMDHVVFRGWGAVEPKVYGQGRGSPMLFKGYWRS